MGAGVYIHIPFCIRKCRYCSFNSVPFDKDQASAYITALDFEIIETSGVLRGIKPTTLYIGGGTPTVIPQGDLLKLIGFIYKRFDLTEGTESTIEANPGTLGGLDLGALRATGINRVSLGVQSFDLAELKLLGRTHGPDEVVVSVKRLREAGFGNVNLDLIYALPGQSLESWAENLKRAIDLGPEHVSLYDLTIDEGTALYTEFRAGRLTLPPEPLQVEMYMHAVETLAGAGYGRYEISNFALPGRECAHNLNYWSGGWYVGIGAGAHTYMDGARKGNIESVPEYMEAASRGAATVATSETLTKAEMEREFIMLGLRKAVGISLDEYTRCFGDDLIKSRAGRITSLKAEGYVEIADGMMRLTIKGVLASNSVITELFG